MDISTELRLAMALTGQKGTDLADEVGVTEATIVNWRKGGGIRKDAFERLLAILDMDRTEFFSLGEKHAISGT